MPSEVSYELYPGFLFSHPHTAQFMIAIQQPSLWWQQFAKELASAMYEGDGEYLYAQVVQAPDYGSSDLQRSAVTCADVPPSHPYNPHTNPTARDLVAEMNYVLNEVSPHFGASLTVSEEDGGCHFWPYYGDEVERFAGPWNHTLAQPMLIVSNVVCLRVLHLLFCEDLLKVLCRLIRMLSLAFS